MATWMVHFRITENLLNKGLLASEKEFVVGNYRTGLWFA